jgi:hypothetical protein
MQSFQNYQQMKSFQNYQQMKVQKYLNEIRSTFSYQEYMPSELLMKITAKYQVSKCLPTILAKMGIIDRQKRRYIRLIHGFGKIKAEDVIKANKEYMAASLEKLKNKKIESIEKFKLNPIPEPTPSPAPIFPESLPIPEPIPVPVQQPQYATSNSTSTSAEEDINMSDVAKLLMDVVEKNVKNYFISLIKDALADTVSQAIQQSITSNLKNSSDNR